MSIAQIAANVGANWHTVNDAVPSLGQEMLTSDPARYDGVTVIGVDEHVWRHQRLCAMYVTVVIDLTPVRAGTGPARLLDMVPGRPKAAFRTWPVARAEAWRDGVEVVAMDGFTGSKISPQFRTSPQK